MKPMPTILFMVACDSLAHPSRELVIAQALRERFNGIIACAGTGKYGALFLEAGFPFYEIAGPPGDFVDRIRNLRKLGGSYIYFLRKQIESELELYGSLQPDLVVLDARWSAVFSAEVFDVPCIAIVNASMLPTPSVVYSSIARTFIRLIGIPWLERVLERVPARSLRAIASVAYKVALFFLRRAVNRVRSTYNLRPLKSATVTDLLQSLQAVILVDLELMAPREQLPENCHYVGPVVWQPAVEMPKALQNSHDLVYITAGSTGNAEMFNLLIAAFDQIPEIEAVVAVGDLVEPERLTPLPGNVQVYRFLPGIEMAKRSQLVICHGGLGTIYQALSQGVPILGIPFLVSHEAPSLDRVEALGVGRKLVDTRLTPEKIARTVREMLGNDAYRKAARDLAARFRLEDGPQRAAAIILNEVGKGREASHV